MLVVATPAITSSLRSSEHLFQSYLWKEGVRCFRAPSFLHRRARGQVLRDTGERHRRHNAPRPEREAGIFA